MKRRPSRRLDLHTRGGFSLIELIISITLLAIILAALMGTVLRVQRDFTIQQSRVQAQEALRVSELIIGTVLRSAEANPMLTGGTLLDPDPSSTGRFDQLRVVSDFNPADGDVTDVLEDVFVAARNDTLYIRWQAGGTTQAMAEPVDSLLFQYFDASGTELTTSATVSSAPAVKVLLTLVGLQDPRTAVVERRTSWIYFRNR